jgi:hypothetical protein
MFRFYKSFNFNKFQRQLSTYVQASERQKHGFVYQSKVINKYNLLEQKDYTAEYDAIYKNIPVQIKCSKYGGSLELGDYRRNKNKNKDFILAIGLWKNNDKSNKVISQEYLLYIEHYNYTKHLGYYNDYIETLMYEEFKNISNHHEHDYKWKEFCIKYKSLWNKDNKISIRFKRDHKKQKRIQCAVSWFNFDDWLLKDFEHISLDISPHYNNHSKYLDYHHLIL